MSPLLLLVAGALLALTAHHGVVSAASPSEVIIRNGRRMGPMGRDRSRNRNQSQGNQATRMTADRNAAARARKEQTQRRRRLTAAIVTNGSFEGSDLSSVRFACSSCMPLFRLIFPAHHVPGPALINDRLTITRICIYYTTVGIPGLHGHEKKERLTVSSL